MKPDKEVETRTRKDTSLRIAGVVLIVAASMALASCGPKEYTYRTRTTYEIAPPPVEVVEEAPVVVAEPPPAEEVVVVDEPPPVEEAPPPPPEPEFEPEAGKDLYFYDGEWHETPPPGTAAAPEGATDSQVATLPPGVYYKADEYLGTAPAYSEMEAPQSQPEYTVNVYDTATYPTETVVEEVYYPATTTYVYESYPTSSWSFSLGYGWGGNYFFGLSYGYPYYYRPYYYRPYCYSSWWYPYSYCSPYWSWSFSWWWGGSWYYPYCRYPYYNHHHDGHDGHHDGGWHDGSGYDRTNDGVIARDSRPESLERSARPMLAADEGGVMRNSRPDGMDRAVRPLLAAEESAPLRESRPDALDRASRPVLAADNAATGREVRPAVAERTETRPAISAGYTGSDSVVTRSNAGQERSPRADVARLESPVRVPDSRLKTTERSTVTERSTRTEVQGRTERNQVTVENPGAPSQGRSTISRLPAENQSRSVERLTTQDRAPVNSGSSRSTGNSTSSQAFRITPRSNDNASSRSAERPTVERSQDRGVITVPNSDSRTTYSGRSPVVVPPGSRQPVVESGVRSTGPTLILPESRSSNSSSSRSNITRIPGSERSSSPPTISAPPPAPSRSRTETSSPVRSAPSITIDRSPSRPEISSSVRSAPPTVIERSPSRPSVSPSAPSVSPPSRPSARMPAPSVSQSPSVSAPRMSAPSPRSMGGGAPRTSAPSGGGGRGGSMRGR